MESLSHYYPGLTWYIWISELHVIVNYVLFIMACEPSELELAIGIYTRYVYWIMLID